MNRTQHHGSAAGRLLDRHLPEGYLAGTTEVVSTDRRTADTGTESILIFRIGLEWLALPTRIFQEVTEPGGIHRLPHRGNILRGLVNVRGELLLCVALDVMLGLEKSPEGIGPKDETTTRRLLVCNRKGSLLAFLVSEVHGVHQFHPRDLKEVPATLAKAAANFTIGVLHWKEGTVGCLDDELLFYALNKGFA
jgi:chemotaxis-related protein WspD